MTKGVVRNKVEGKGFGFILNGGQEYFFHSSECITPFELLQPGTEVQFEVKTTSKGKRAHDVEMINK